MRMSLKFSRSYRKKKQAVVEWGLRILRVLKIFRKYFEWTDNEKIIDNDYLLDNSTLQE